MNTLRSLRLWHWQKVLSYTSVAENFEAAQKAWDAKYNPPYKSSYNATKAKNARREAARHQSAVDALNEVVPGRVEDDWSGATREPKREDP